jgi:hypothetical protein
MKAFLLGALCPVVAITVHMLILQEERRPMLDTLSSLKAAFERLAQKPGLRANALKCIVSVEYFQKATTEWEPRRPTDGEGMRVSTQEILRVVKGG